MECLINDLKCLENEGIDISIGNETINFVGTVVAILGDNLESHQIGDFTENFNSEYFCRFCDITQNQFQSKYTCTNINRNSNNYNLCVTQARKIMKVVKGIKHDSPLNKLNYFHICNPGLPPCIAHDLFEGIVPCDLMYCIKYFVKEGWFTYQFLSYRLQKMKFLYKNVRNSILLIRDSTKIVDTASQIRKILLIFPLAIFDVIKNIEDNVWILMLSSRNMFFNLCSCFVLWSSCIITRKDKQLFIIESKMFSKYQIKAEESLYFPLSHFNYMF